MIKYEHSNRLQKVIIQARKYNEKLHYEWEASLVELTSSYSLVYCEAGRTFTHHTKQKQFIMPYPSLEWFFFDKGYTVAISLKPEGLMYYCNIALPAQLTTNRLSFIDLDLDYIKEVDEEWKLVDEDEFVIHQKEFNYPKEIIQFALHSVDQLKAAIEEKHYPFSLSDEQLLMNIKQCYTMNK